MSELKKITGLWLNQSKKGTKYFSGKISEALILNPGDKILIFENDKKGNDRAPDYQLSVSTNSDSNTPKYGDNPFDDSGIPIKN